jgi:hypothetical protein
MSPDKQASDAADPKQPHAFVEKVNVPFAIPRPGMMAAGLGQGPEIPFRRAGTAEGCGVCGKPRLDKVHEAAEQTAEAEELRWPV